MAIANIGIKAVSGIFTDAGVLKLVLEDGSYIDCPVVATTGGSIVDNGDGTVSVTIA